MSFLRTGTAALVLAACTACANQPQLAPSAKALQRVAAEARILSDARDYSRFAVARYASLTEDPDTAAYYYGKLATGENTDSILAERALFSALLLGDVEQATEIAESLEPGTLARSELGRLTLAVNALKADQSKTAAAWLELGKFRSAFNASLATGMLAWLTFETDPDAAIQLQAAAGTGDLVLDRLAQTFAALMLVQAGEEEEAADALAALWDLNARTALGVEAEVQLLVSKNELAAARERLRTFREDVGLHPQLADLSDRLDRGALAPADSLSVQEAIAKLFYASAAALTDDVGGDVAGVYFALALHLDSDLHAARALWADALDQAGRHDEAVELLAEIPDTSIFHTTAQGQLAWSFLRQGEEQKAISTASATLARTDDRNIRIQLGDLLQTTGRLGEAEAVFTQAVDADAKEGRYDWRLYFARGSVRERLGYWAPAENDLKTALGLNPDNPAILNYLGYSWVDRGLHLEEGLNLLRQAHALAPENGAVTDSLGWALYKLGEYDRAVLHLERAAELRPQDPHILGHLGDAYWKVGRYTEAGYQWQRALDYAETEQDRAVFAEKLENGMARLSALDSPSATERP